MEEYHVMRHMLIPRDWEDLSWMSEMHLIDRFQVEGKTLTEVVYG